MKINLDKMTRTGLIAFCLVNQECEDAAKHAFLSLLAKEPEVVRFCLVKLYYQNIFCFSMRGPFQVLLCTGLKLWLKS